MIIDNMKAGDLVKRAGLVLYADGWKRKVSKKTWLISKVEDGKVFYKDENGNDTLLPLPKNEGEFIVVGDENGVFPEHLENEVTVRGGGVSQKYRVHGDLSDKNWKDGDIVQITGKVSQETLDSGKLELVPDSVPHQHVLIVVDPILLNNALNHG